MSVNVTVYGADQTSDEYTAALKLKRIIQDSVPNSAIGEIVLFASATLIILGFILKVFDEGVKLCRCPDLHFLRILFAHAPCLMAGIFF